MLFAIRQGSLHKKRLAILKEAVRQTNSSGYLDAMSGRLMSDREDDLTEFWKKACRLKCEAAALYAIHENDLGE